MSDGTTSALESGALLRDTYLIHEVVASGGMGEVYLATHVRLPGKFAIKVLSSPLANEPPAVARFCREAAIISVLRHPNIVQVYDFNVTTGGLPYLVMEYLDGADLSQRLGESGPMALARVARLVRQVAGALESAHARGIVHRDLKPANVVLMDWEGQPDFVKVLDFGVSKICGADRVTGEWAVLGTPAYMAPEQALGHGEDVEPRTDQFSLAALTYVLLTGIEPFSGETALDKLHSIVHAQPRPLEGRVPWPAEPVEAVIRKALAKRREDRFARVLDFAEALDTATGAVLAAGGGAAAGPPLSGPGCERGRRVPRRRGEIASRGETQSTARLRRVNAAPTQKARIDDPDAPRS